MSKPGSVFLFQFALLIFSCNRVSLASEVNCKGFLSRLLSRGSTISDRHKRDPTSISIQESKLYEPELVQFSREQVELFRSKTPSQNKTSDYVAHLAEIRRYQNYLERNGVDFSGKALTSPKADDRKKGLENLFLEPAGIRVAILIKLLKSDASPEVKRMARRALVALGSKTEYSAQDIQDIQMELEKSGYDISSGLALDLTQLPENEFKSFQLIKASQRTPNDLAYLTFLARGRPIETQLQFLRSNGFTEQEISHFKSKYESDFAYAKELLLSDNQGERYSANFKLRSLLFQTPEVHEVLWSVLEKEKIEEHKLLAARALMDSSIGVEQRILSDQVEQPESVLRLAISSQKDKLLSVEDRDSTAEKAFSNLRLFKQMENHSNSSQRHIRWESNPEDLKAGQTLRGLEGYYFSNHVYDLPEIDNSRWFGKNSPLDGEDLVNQRMAWESKLRQGWKVQDTVMDPQTGLKAAVYSNTGSHGKVARVYAFAGTQSKKDVMADVGLGRIQVQSPHFQRFVETAAQDILAGDSVLVTGHSLGGGVAQAFSYFVSKRARQIKSELLGAEHAKRKMYGDSAGETHGIPTGNISTVTWMAFGAADLVRSVEGVPRGLKDFVETNKNDPFEIKVQIENYRLKGDPVSSVGEFIGPVYDLGGADPSYRAGRFPALSSHPLTSAMEIAFVKGGLDTASPSKRLQLPRSLTQIVNENLGPLMERKLKKSFEENWREYFAALTSARLKWEKRQGFQFDRAFNDNILRVSPGGVVPTPWLKRELEVMLEQAPEKYRAWASEIFQKTETAIEQIHSEKRKSPFAQ